MKTTSKTTTSAPDESADTEQPSSDGRSGEQEALSEVEALDSAQSSLEERDPPQGEDAFETPTAAIVGGRIIWIDLETTGLDPAHDRLLEVGLIITNDALETLAQGQWLVRCDPDFLQNCHAADLHRANGLMEVLLDEDNGALPLEQVEAELTALLQEHCGEPAGRWPLAGSSVHFDRNFIKRWLPETFAHLHYRNIDVSTLHQLVKRWRPRLRPPWKPREHRAYSDIKDSLDELRWYMKHVFMGAPPLLDAPVARGLEAMAARDQQD